MLGLLPNSSDLFLNSIFYNFLLICFVIHSLIQSWGVQWKILAFRSWTGVTLNTPDLIGHVTLGKSFNFSESGVLICKAGGNSHSLRIRQDGVSKSLCMNLAHSWPSRLWAHFS